MANTSSAKKMVRKIARRTAINKTRRSRMRTFVKKVEQAIAGGTQDDARAALGTLTPELMRASSKGLVHRNAVARKLSRLSKRIKAIGAQG